MKGFPINLQTNLYIFIPIYICVCAYVSLCVPYSLGMCSLNKQIDV